MKKSTLFIMFLVLSLTSISSVSALSIVTHVPEKYTDVHAGERLYFEIEVKYPENPTRKDLRLEYEIKKDDEIIAQSKVLKAIETQASFMDFIVIPESAEKGMHIIKVKITDYEDLSEEVSASFHVIGKKEDQMKMYSFIIISVVVIVGLLIMVEVYVIRKK